MDTGKYIGHAKCTENEINLGRRPPTRRQIHNKKRTNDGFPISVLPLLNQEFRDRAAQLAHEKNLLDEREAASRAAEDAAAGVGGAGAGASTGGGTGGAGGEMNHVRKNLLNDMKDATDAGAGSKAGSRPMSGAGSGAGAGAGIGRPEEDGGGGGGGGGGPEGRRAAPDVAEEKGSGSGASAGAGTKAMPSSGASAGGAVYGGSSKDDLIEDGDGASRLRLDRADARHADSESERNLNVHDRKAAQPTIPLGGARQPSFAGAGAEAEATPDRGGLGPDVAEDKVSRRPVLSRQNTSDNTAAAAAAGAGGDASPSDGPVRMSTLLARPHHIPKMNDSLASRMNDLRKTMGCVRISSPYLAPIWPVSSPYLAPIWPLSGPYLAPI